MSSYTQAEAEALVGRHVRSLRAFADVPEGTQGTIRGAWRSGDGWSVDVRWHRAQDILNERLRLKALTDDFNRSEVEQHLVFIPALKPMACPHCTLMRRSLGDDCPSCMNSGLLQPAGTGGV